jgi:hypothetical protein
LLQASSPETFGYTIVCQLIAIYFLVTVVDVAGKTRTKDKYRVVYSDHQRLELEKEFHYSRYITIRRKAELAANLGLSERQVSYTLMAYCLKIHLSIFIPRLWARGPGFDSRQE